jgi:hypothetical protein
MVLMDRIDPTLGVVAVFLLAATILVVVFWATRGPKDKRIQGCWVCPFCNHVVVAAMKTQEALDLRLELASKLHLNTHNSGTPIDVKGPERE